MEHAYESAVLYMSETFGRLSMMGSVCMRGLWRVCPPWQRAAAVDCRGMPRQASVAKGLFSQFAETREGADMWAGFIVIFAVQGGMRNL